MIKSLWLNPDEKVIRYTQPVVFHIGQESTVCLPHSRNSLMLVRLICVLPQYQNPLHPTIPLAWGISTEILPMVLQ